MSLAEYPANPGAGCEISGDRASDHRAQALLMVQNARFAVINAGVRATENLLDPRNSVTLEPEDDPNYRNALVARDEAENNLHQLLDGIY